MLVFGGKVFLQSDIEAVAVRMKDEFMGHDQEKLGVVDPSGQWLKENPFGVASDWEKHVLERGDPMYRLLLFKLGS
ncbi:unnamed protein product [Cuscuta campestris]|uniref:tRNA (guanine(46)-N(7))-methyltransferase n=1 Tax=Cuscuta campestris TaxID=132261 RepID=A0A484MGE8_9ASTE|nr:unnamed protein product [Cuscuta campestris]VFQ87880.1 unnamed protein product [Cuscuta campestris]